MERLVYRPKIWAYVKTDKQAIDLTPYIVAGSVNRVVNDVSKASLTIRNPDFKFTTPGSPVFHPMDPITIYMARNINRPVRVFTGFLDSTPYLQLFPGTVVLEASCTLKKLKYTYWDPALPFSKYFIGQYGWQQYQDGTFYNKDAAKSKMPKQKLNDGGFQNILFGVLEAVGGWQENDIFIEELPPTIVNNVMKIFGEFKEENEETEKALRTFLKEAIGETAAGAAATSDGNNNQDYGTPKGKPKFDDGDVVEATVYGPPWNSVEGGDKTATGVHLPGPTNNSKMNGPYIIASDPDYIPYHNKVYVWPNPFNYRGTFSCEDTGGAFQGRTGRIDIFDPRGRRWQNSFGGVKGIRNNSDGPNGGKYVQIWDASNGNPFESSRRTVLPKHGTVVENRNGGRNRSRSSSSRRNRVNSASIKEITGGSDLVNAARDLVDTSTPGSSNESGDSNPTLYRSNRVVAARTPSLAGDLPGGLPTPRPVQERGPTPAGKRDRDSGRSDKPLWPLPSQYTQTSSGFGPRNAPTAGASSNHQGIDIPAPRGTPVYAVKNGRVTFSGVQGGYGETIEINHGGGLTTLYAHLQEGTRKVRVGQNVKRGDTIAGVNSTGVSTGDHLHFGLKNNGSFVDPAPWLQGAEAQAGSGTVDASGASGGGISKEAAQGIATASAFSTFLEMPSQLETLESTAYAGQKSYINDKPLIEFVEQLCTASMRHYMSLPDGRFYAFFPDYFGTFRPDRPPYWEIDDIELIEGSMELSDEELKTHVYVVGDTNFNAQIDVVDKMSSPGIVTIFNAFESNWLLSQAGGKGKQALFKDAVGFLSRYGVRPDFHPEPIIRSHYYEAFAGFQRFMFLWSRQFLTQFEFTFMPELFPGGRVAFKDHDLVCYIDSVQHQFDYTTGFQTFAQLSAPSAADTNDDGMMEKFTYGMVKSFGTA